MGCGCHVTFQKHLDSGVAFAEHSLASRRLTCLNLAGCSEGSIALAGVDKSVVMLKLVYSFQFLIAAAKAS